MFHIEYNKNFYNGNTSGSCQYPSPGISSLTYGPPELQWTLVKFFICRTKMRWCELAYVGVMIAGLSS